MYWFYSEVFNHYSLPEYESLWDFDVYVYSRISMHDGLLQKNDVLSFFSLEKVLKEI